MAESFDAVVVGAGPAGSAAALVLARAGRSVALIERGPFPGSKNMYGGVVYGRILDQLVPNWWDQAPIQRWVTRRSTMVVTPTQAMTVDYRSEAWAQPPYNGATTFRPDFDSWLAGLAVEAGATLIPSTTVLHLHRRPGGQVTGVETDRPGGDIETSLVIACDGVNSFLAKEAGLYRDADPSHFTLGAKEVLHLPKEEIDRRFALRGLEGADMEIIGCTGDVAGGGFLYTNLESISVGVVLSLPGLSRSGRRPEEFIADLKAHPSIAPLVEGGRLEEYSGHLIPEGGWDMMPDMVGDGLMVAGDAAALCLAAGLWLEGVNFAIASGAAAGQTAVEALDASDTRAPALSGYRRRLEESFVLQDHRKLRRAPHLVLSERMQQRYPGLICNLVEGMFRVDNPEPKPGAVRLLRQEAKRAGVGLTHLARDGWSAFRSFG